MGLFTTKTNADHTGNETFFFHTSNKALIIFARNPELGKVKTRLAKVTGDETALKIYKFLIEHTVEITTALRVDKYVYYSDQIGLNDLWDETVYRKRLQCGGDLGIRMQFAFHDLFTEGYEQVVIIGTDIYDLSAEIISEAFDALYTHDAVVGPAEDGGYYLLGMKTLIPGVFSEKEWGTPTVLEDTLNSLKDKSVKLLSEMNDVDCYEDIQNVPAFLPFLKSMNSK